MTAGTEGMTRIVLEARQELLLKLALQMARDDYETRTATPGRGAGPSGGQVPGQANRRRNARAHQGATRRWSQHRRDGAAGRLQQEPSQARDGAALGGKRAWTGSAVLNYEFLDDPKSSL